LVLGRENGLFDSSKILLGQINQYCCIVIIDKTKFSLTHQNLVDETQTNSLAKVKVPNKIVYYLIIIKSISRRKWENIHYETLFKENKKSMK
jgi:hypothetical protein